MNIEKMKNHLKWFTLVELIIVITILAILAVIAFMSYQSYIKWARDSQRLSTVWEIRTWLELYYTQVGNYPLPDDIYWTWKYSNWSETIDLNYVWYVWNDVSKKIRMNKIPVDPVSGNKYIIWTSSNNQKYQIASILEDIQANTNIFLNYTYAENSIYKAALIWNYQYPLKLWNKIYTLPSLVFIWEQIWDPSTFTWFIIDGGNNIPYNSINNNETVEQQLQQLTWTQSTLAFTWVDISAYNSAESFKSADITDLTQITWIQDRNILWNVLFGDKFFPIENNSNSNSNNNEEGSSEEEESNQEVTNESYFVFNPDTKTITWYEWEKLPKDVVIPSQIWWVDVETIWNMAFFNKWINSVVIPDGVKKIDYGAFRQNKLTNIDIPPSVEIIESCAFLTNNISDFTLPKDFKNLWEWAFNGNNLSDDKAFFYKMNEDGTTDYSVLVGYWWGNKNPVIPDTVRTLWYLAFWLSPLDSVVLPEGLTTIWDGSFQYTWLKEITFPKSVIEVWEESFFNEYWHNITDFVPWEWWTWRRRDDPYSNNHDWLKIDYTDICYKDTTNDNYFGFDDTTKTIVSYNPEWWTHVVIPCKIWWIDVENIWDSAFNSTNLESVVFPNSIISIWPGSFSNNQITSVTLWNWSIDISDYAFYNNKLSNIFIPSSVVSIWPGAFSNNWPDSNSPHYDDWSSFIWFSWFLNESGNWEKVIAL